MLDRPTMLRAGAAILGVAIVSLLFIGSYAGALHDPQPHEIPIAVTAQVPAELAQRLDASGAFAVRPARDRAGALSQIAHRDAYGAIVARADGSIELVTAPAAGPAVAAALTGGVLPELARAGVKATTTVTHDLPHADARGLVGFYTAVGWVVAGYLGATFLGITFGTKPGRVHTAWRLAGLGVLALLVGIAGAALAAAIGDLGGSVLALGLVGALTIATVGAVTIALQSTLGIAGTGLAVLLFVVAGNPSSGGPFPVELLPEPWRTIGPLIPTGAATTLLRDVAYFPSASVAGPLLVLFAWLVAGVAVAMLLGHRRGPLTDAEAEAAIAGAMAP